MAKRNLGLETNDVRVRHPRLAPSYKRTRSPRVVIKDFAMYRKFALCSLVCLFFFNFIWNEKINVVVLNLAEFLLCCTLYLGMESAIIQWPVEPLYEHYTTSLWVKFKMAANELWGGTVVLVCILFYILAQYGLFQILWW